MHQSIPDDGPDKSTPGPVPPIVSSPSVEYLVNGVDSTLQWDIRLLDNSRFREVGDRGQARDDLMRDIVHRTAEGPVSGPMPKDRQLVMVLHVENFGMEKQASLGVARGINTVGMEAGCSLQACESMQDSRGNPSRSIVARIVVVDARDTKGFARLFNVGPSSSKRPNRPSSPPRSGRSVGKGLFPADPKCVPARLDGELFLHLVGGSHARVAENQRRFSPE